MSRFGCMLHATMKPWRRPLPQNAGRTVVLPYGGLPMVFRRASGRYPFVLDCQPADDAREDDFLALIGRIHSSLALTGLQRGKDYRWNGVNEIGFRTKRRAALLILELSA